MFKIHEIVVTFGIIKPHPPACRVLFEKAYKEQSNSITRNPEKSNLKAHQYMKISYFSKELSVCEH